MVAAPRPKRCLQLNRCIRSSIDPLMVRIPADLDRYSRSRILGTAQMATSSPPYGPTIGSTYVLTVPGIVRMYRLINR